MRAQWVCSRERRIALYKRSSIINQSICPRTAKHKHSPKNKNLSQMAKCCFSYCAPKQWNSLPSDISHMQSPHAFKTALNIHLYKNSTTCDFRFYLLPFLPSFPSLLPYYNLHSFCVSVCASVCVCVCVCVHTGMVCKQYNMITYYFGVLCIYFCSSCKARCAHPCWWDTVL